MDRVDLKVIQSEHYQRREQYWLSFLKGPHWRNGIDRDTFNAIFDLAFSTGHRLGYDEGFNDAQMNKALGLIPESGPVLIKGGDDGPGQQP